MTKMVAATTQNFEGVLMRLLSLISYDSWGGRKQLGCYLMSEGYLNHVYDDNADSTGINKPEVGGQVLTNRSHLCER